jgi:hypothetical protein
MCNVLVDCPELLILVIVCMCSVNLLWNVPSVAIRLVDAVSLHLFVHWCFLPSITLRSAFRMQCLIRCLGICGFSCVRAICYPEDGK